jgi:hypothetical protein
VLKRVFNSTNKRSALFKISDDNSLSVKVFSLPSVDHPQYGRHIELGVKGAPDAAAPAFETLKKGLAAFGVQFGPELVRK